MSIMNLGFAFPAAPSGISQRPFCEVFGIEGTEGRVGHVALLPWAGNTNTTGVSPTSLSLGRLE